ncbi:MAG: hypothetical protein EYC62_07345 [Alphaproteobacteria bacterium]|nr:MAG: hypothetical protein EYC62_07345 [Alphaproteobacteria bacterium]
MANIPSDPKKRKSREVILPNKLREKVGGMPGKLGSIDPDIISRAEKKVEEISKSYTESASDELAELQEAFVQCSGAEGDAQAPYIRKINRLVHELRGQGSSFGYPLLTEFATFLFDFTDGLKTASKPQLEIIKAHIDTMQIVVIQKINGDGGTVGQQLKQTLKVAIERYSKKS